MKEILAVINQKGGVGKSTTAQALGVGLSLRGNRVLFVDMDAQGNLSYALGASGGGPTIIDVLTGKVDARAAIQKPPQGDVIQASPALAGADTVITATGKEYRLKESLESIMTAYDYVVIDTPPALGILTVNALAACTSAVIPAQADTYSLQGIGQLHTTVATIRKYCNDGLKVRGILLTRYSPRTILSRDLTDMIAEAAGQLDTTLFKATIREAIAIKEAQARRQDIFSYAPKSSVAGDYNAFVDELLERVRHG